MIETLMKEIKDTYNIVFKDISLLEQAFTHPM